MKLAKITTTGSIRSVRNTQSVIYKKGYSPFIQGGTWWQYDEGVKGYIDTSIPAQGPTGEQGPMERMPWASLWASGSGEISIKSTVCNGKSCLRIRGPRY